MMRGKGNRWPAMVWLATVWLVLAAGTLALAACQGSSSSKTKSNPYVDTRSDAELKAVMDQALADAQADDPTYATVDAVTDTNGLATGLVVEGQASGAMEEAGSNHGLLTRAGAATAERFPAGTPGRLLADRALGRSLERALARASAPGVRALAFSVTLDEIYNCVGGGTAGVTGLISATVVQLSSAFSYNATVDLVRCTDASGDVLYGEVVYAGLLVSDSTDGVTVDFDSNLTINGGIAAAIFDSVSATTAHYNFILRDSLDLTGSNVNIVEGTGDWRLNLSLRLDDGLLNVVCTATGAATSEVVTAANYTCSATATVL